MDYKDLKWLQEIPKHWKIDRLKDCCERITGGGTPKSSISEYWEEGNIIWVTPTDFSRTKSKYISDSVKKITELGVQKSSANKLPKGTVIMSSRASIGDVKIADTELTTNQGFVSYIPSYKLNDNFLYYVISCHLGEYFLNIASGTTFMEISRKMASLEYIPLPPKKEQIAIANYLDKACERIDKIVKLKEKQILKLDNYFKNKISEFTTQGLGSSVLTPTDCLWIPEIKKGWKIKPLKRLLNSKLKYGANEPAINEDTTEPRYIRITDFSKDGKLKNNTFKSLPFDKAKEYLLKEGDVLFARSGATVGKTFIFKDYDGIACFAGYLIKAECNQDLLLPEYLYFFTKSKGYEEWKNIIFTQATIQNIGADKYQYLKISIPPSIEEQREIVDKIINLQKKIDDTKSKIKNQIKTLKNYRKSLIHECVTGKKQIVKVETTQSI